MINETLDKQIKLNNKIRELEDKLSLIQRAREDKLNITDKSETFEAQLIQLENEFNKALKSLYEETKDNKEELKEIVGKLCYIIKLKEKEKEYNKELIDTIQNKNKSIEKTVINLKDSISNVMSIARFVEDNKVKQEKRDFKKQFLPKISTSKLLILFLFINCTIIELFTGFVTLKSLDLTTLTMANPDFTPLVALIGAVVSEVVGYAVYALKSAKENTAGGITYEAAMRQIDEDKAKG